MNSPAKTTATATPLWLWPNLLGLDAPIVAVSWQWLFAHSFEIDLPFAIHIILGLSAWCVYLADRLIDVKRHAPNEHETERHHFTRTHFKPLVAALLIAAITNLVFIISAVPPTLFASGIFTASLVGIYYLVRFYASSTALYILPREILCGMLFALGSAIGPHAFAPDSQDHLAYFLPVAFLGVLCSVSCILISIWERSADLATADNSFGTLRPYLASSFSSGLIGLSLISLVVSFYSTTEVYMAIAISALALSVAIHFEDRLTQPMRRVLADALLLSPLPVLAWSLF